MSFSLLSGFLGRTETHFVEVSSLPPEPDPCTRIHSSQLRRSSPPPWSSAKPGTVQALVQQWRHEFLCLLGATARPMQSTSPAAAQRFHVSSSTRNDTVHQSIHNIGATHTVCKTSCIRNGITTTWGSPPSLVMPRPQLNPTSTPPLCGSTRGGGVDTATVRAAAHLAKMPPLSPLALGAPSERPAFEATEESDLDATSGSFLTPAFPRKVSLGHPVALVRSSCYSPVVAPLLVVFDLDNTIIDTPLSDLSLVENAPPERMERRFIDAPLFAWFCEMAHQAGHLLAIASLTDGAADRHLFHASTPETVLFALDRVLPAQRRYLASVADVVCQPQTRRAPGKLSHLQKLQRRLNAAWLRSIAVLEHGCATGTSTVSYEDAFDDASNSGLNAVTESDSSAHTSLHTAPDQLQPTAELSSVAPQLPSWLCTDILLVDDNHTNCEVADRFGYRALCCGETGFTREWYNAQTQLQRLLGLPSFSPLVT